MRTEAEICNLALLRIGQRDTIDALSEATESAQACAILYPHTRDKLLSRRPWPFAKKSATLALLTTTRPGWTYAYALPTDCLEPRYLFAGARPGGFPIPIDPCFDPSWARVSSLSGRVPTIPYSIASSDDGAGRILLTDAANAQLVYTEAVSMVPAMPTLFQEALAKALAAELAPALRVQLPSDLVREAEAALQRAWAGAMNSEQPDELPDSEFISVRA